MHARTVVIEKDGLLSTESSDRLIVAKRHDERDDIERKDISRDAQKTVDRTGTTEDRKCDEFMLDKTIRKDCDGDDIKYEVAWHVHRAKQAVKTAEHIPGHIFNHYCKMVVCQLTRSDGN